MALFDSYAQSYDSWYGTERGRTIWQLELRILLSFLEPQPGEQILDAGCGTGILALELASRGLRVTGVDLSEKMLALAREKIYGHKVGFLRADICALPFSDGYFDAVICFTVLEFVGEPESALQELWRVLKPGGRLVIGVLNRFSLWALARRGRGVYGHARFYTLWEIRKMMTAVLAPGSFRWTGAVYFPPGLPVELLRYAGVFEFTGSFIARPFGAVLILRVDKS
ncbi:MAG: class I SAM-dependent methyltransferase [Firmicutes bacterium]|nr:class I SAM-dependent methyltransferase [Bacillota bacterium]